MKTVKTYLKHEENIIWPLCNLFCTADQFV